jgi:hypothetical protein
LGPRKYFTVALLGAAGESRVVARGDGGVAGRENEEDAGCDDDLENDEDAGCDDDLENDEDAGCDDDLEYEEDAGCDDDLEYEEDVAGDSGLANDADAGVLAGRFGLMLIT